MQLYFLDWKRPILHSAADFIVEHFRQAGNLDLQSVVLALPSSRAIVRLEEILLEKVESEIRTNR
ncbi:MAG: hypothetical protein ACRC2T_01280, partial [Thermoguttaceae bacterium]